MGPNCEVSLKIGIIGEFGNQSGGYEGGGIAHGNLLLYGPALWSILKEALCLWQRTLCRFVVLAVQPVCKITEGTSADLPSGEMR